MAKITITTSEAVRNLKLVMQELRDLKKTSNKVGLSSSKSLKVIETQLKSIRIANTRTNKSFKSLEQSLHKNTIAQNRNTAAQRSQRVATNQLTGSIYKKIRAGKLSRVGDKKSASSMNMMSASAGRLIGAFGIIQGLRMFGRLIVDTYKLLKQFDSLDFAMSTIVKSSYQLASSQSFLLDITKSYGLELLSTSQRYLKFLASAQQVNLSLNDTQKIFRSVSKAAAVLGLETHETTGVYLALEQMLSKGKVTTEELRRQLGERLPGAMGIMASALGVTISALDKMLKKGEVLSAEALPKFALALESAYGIESVRKIDTLVSAQNRMSNAWKIFRKNLVDANPWLEKSLKWIQNYTAEVLELYSLLLGSEDYTLLSGVAKEQKAFEEVMRKSTQTVVDARAEQGERLNQLNKKIANQRINIDNAYRKDNKDGEENNILVQEEMLNQLLQKKLKFNEKVKRSNIEWAQSAINQASNSTAIAKKNYEDTLKEIKDLSAKQDVSFGATYRLGGLRAEELNTLNRLKEDLPFVRNEYEKFTAKLNIFKGLIEETFVKPVIPIDPDGAVNTDELDLQILKLKNNIKDIEAFMKRKDNSQNQRVQATLDLFVEETKLIDAQYEKQLKLSKENAIKKNIAQEKQDQREEEILTEFSKRKSDLTEKFFKEELSEVVARNEALLNIEKIALKDKFDLLINPSLKQKAKYNEDLSELERIFGNKTLKEQADFVGVWLDSIGVFGEERVALERKILALLAKLKADSSTKNKKTKKEELEEELLLVKEFLNEIGALLDAIGSRRLENIDAEIVAEEKKYDKLISLAKNDAKEKESLEKQKSDRMEVLEAKRLKEEQKQAKIRKAFAIAEIAINTAVAVSKVWGQTGVFGIAAQIPVLIMGALQTATVLAAPIPQYADGVENLAQDERAMINDGGQKEYVERDGKILSTNTKNAIVGLKKGDTVYRNKEHMMNSSQVYTQRNNLISKLNVERQNISNEISKEIKKGFKGVELKNNINFTNRLNNNSYLKDKARF
jgi:tape measure domain-containing protein